MENENEEKQSPGDYLWRCLLVDWNQLENVLNEFALMGFEKDYMSCIDDSGWKWQLIMKKKLPTVFVTHSH